MKVRSVRCLSPSSFRRSSLNLPSILSSLTYEHTDGIGSWVGFESHKQFAVGLTNSWTNQSTDIYSRINESAYRTFVICQTILMHMTHLNPHSLFYTLLFVCWTYYKSVNECMYQSLRLIPSVQLWVATTQSDAIKPFRDNPVTLGSQKYFNKDGYG